MIRLSSAAQWWQSVGLSAQLCRPGAHEHKQSLGSRAYQHARHNCELPSDTTCLPCRITGPLGIGNLSTSWIKHSRSAWHGTHSILSTVSAA